ncbi:hypothetical protein ANTPLA_LOCUS10151 [Anthophora plagiata]
MAAILAGDGNVSFEEFVEIVSNIGANETAPTDQDQEEQELRDAFRDRQHGNTRVDTISPNDGPIRLTI